MPISVRNAGVWTDVKDIYINNAGTWAKTKDVWIRNAGVWSKAHVASLNLTIAASTTQYNIKSAAIAAGWNGVDNIRVILTVNSGVVVSSNATTTGYAMLTDTGWPSGSYIEIYNYGTIVAQGGDGGNGGNYPNNTNGGVGGNGGTALYAQVATTLYNYGTIAGGGGGGNGENGYQSGTISCTEMCSINYYKTYGGDGGGGGRSGSFNSNGGGGGVASGTYGTNGSGGGAGTFAAAGAAGGFNAQAGGDWGTSSGGTRGNYILGFSLLTIAVAGTLLGGTA